MPKVIKIRRTMLWIVALPERSRHSAICILWYCQRITCTALNTYNETQRHTHTQMLEHKHTHQYMSAEHAAQIMISKHHDDILATLILHRVADCIVSNTELWRHLFTFYWTGGTCLRGWSYPHNFNTLREKTFKNLGCVSWQRKAMAWSKASPRISLGQKRRNRATKK